MGVDTRKPPLPAPTDISSTDNTSALDTHDDLVTNLSLRTDKTHYTIPEDGTPVTITTKKHKDPKKQSSTSLLIEYFEGGKEGRSPTSRPSLRVRVTPSASRKSKHGRDHIQISETNKSGGRSAVRRISLTGRDSDNGELTSGSDLSANRPPIDVEVLHDQSEESELGTQSALSRYMVPPSDISSMPPDSLLDGPRITSNTASRPNISSTDKSYKLTSNNSGLKVPRQDDEHSASKERLAQRVMEKLQQNPGGRSRTRRTSHDREHSTRSAAHDTESHVEDVSSSKRRASRIRDENSINPSEISNVSSRSAISSSSINNPRLLNAVEDAIKKLILPELKAVKDEQRAIKNRQKYDDLSRSSTSSRVDEPRRVSKSSSLPSVKPNKRDTVVEKIESKHGDSSRRRRSSSRRSSRESFSERSYETTRRESHSRRRSSGEQRASKDNGMSALATGLSAAALAGLGTATLKHQSSHSTIDKDRTKRRSKSRSRSRSTVVSDKHGSRAEELIGTRPMVPPLPMQSVMESELTRASLLSTDTERPSSRASSHTLESSHRIHNVSYGSPDINRASTSFRQRDSLASSGLDSISQHHNQFEVTTDPVTKLGSHSRGSKKHIVATGLGAAAAAATVASLSHKRSRDFLISSTRGSSPVQSESSSLREYIDDSPQHARVRSIRSHHSMMSARESQKASPSNHSPNSATPRKDISGSKFNASYEILPEDEYSPTTPQGDELERWMETEHVQHDRYRREIDQQSPHNIDTTFAKHQNGYDDESLLLSNNHELPTDQHILSLGAKPAYVHPSAAVESAVASLQEPSTISVHSSESSSVHQVAIGSRNMQNQHHVPAFASNGSRQRWEVIRDRAMAMTNRMDSPAQSEPQSLEDQPLMSATYVPTGDIPEIGVMPDDESELITNPSIISGRMGHGSGLASFDATPPVNLSREVLANDAVIQLDNNAAVMGLGVAAFGTPDLEKHYLQTSAHDFEDARMDDVYIQSKLQLASDSPLQAKDEGYMSANPALSPAGRSGSQHRSKGYETAYIDELEDDEDFTSQKHLKHESGLSHGMQSPLYDSATGKGMDRIHSKDVVALMNHLTARDAQRNARDTEILVTLVHSAAEMRNNFEDMKRYIAEQDRIIMRNMDRGNANTIQRVLSGPRPQPLGSPRTPRRQASDDGDDVPSKRANVFRRALKGLSTRSTTDLTRIEDMLLQLLKEMEDLKDNQQFADGTRGQQPTVSLNSYEHLRAVPDPGYEPSGRAGTNSSPAQSGYLSLSSSKYLNNMHSGYDASKPPGEHRISTVLEDDEDVEEPLQTPLRNGRYADEEEVSLPERHDHGRHVMLQTPTPPLQNDQTSLEPTPKTDKSRSKYKSGSSIFGGIAKISRWSKTTASTIPDNALSNSRKKGRPSSADSRGDVNADFDYEYEIDDDDDLSRLHESPDNEHPRSSHVSARPGSPLVPEYEHDDPKYQVHRNSQNLQHPQPRPGPTHRHQSNLENQAINFGQSRTPVADQWGSVPALALNRNRYSTGSPQQLSPAHSEDNDSRSSASDELAQYERYTRASDDGPLIPQRVPNTSTNSKYEMYGVPMMSSGMHIASPLEPIEEVRKSLETDRSSVRLESTPSPHPTAMRSVQRKITGPREMPRSVSSSSKRRHGAGPSGSPVSYETYRTSLDGSETF